MGRTIALMFSGALFAVGLGISGMTQPAKVIGFLDFFGKWDPALMFVMGGAVVVYGIGHRLVLRRGKPFFSLRFELPTRKDLTLRLIGGSALFGVGWGLGGFCPGPALTSTVTGLTPVLAFTGSMLAGMWLFHQFEQARMRRALQKKEEQPKQEAKQTKDAVLQQTEDAALHGEQDKEEQSEASFHSSVAV